MPDAVVRINHITDEMLAGQPIIQDVLPFFLEFVGDCVLVAHNARFDASFLAQACMRNRYKVPNQFFDSMELARYYPEAKNKKQDTLLRCARISNSLAHRALGDAQSLAQFVILTFKQEKQRKEQIQNDELAKIIITDTDRRLFNVQCPVEDILNKDDWDKGFQQGSPYYFQGEVLRKSGRLEDALILYNKARYMGYNAPALYRSYAMCYRKMKQYDNEISIIDEFLERNPGEKEDQFQERKEKAIQLLQKQQSIS